MITAVRDGLSRRRWICWWSIWGPIATIILSGKYVRVLRLREPVSALNFVDLMRSELLVALGLGVFGYVLLASAPAGRRFLAWMAAFQLLAGAFLIPNMVGHQFYMATGAGMTWELFIFGASSLRALYDVLNSGFSSAQVLATLVLQLYFFLVPPYLWWRNRAKPQTAESPPGGGSHMVPGVMQAGPNSPAERSLSPDKAERQRPKRRILLPGLLGALALFAFAFLPYNLAHINHNFSREPLLNLLSGAFNVSKTRSIAHYPPLFDVSSIALKPRSSSDTAPDTARNLAIVILESTRADATTPYKPSLQTTPFLAELAEESLLYEQAYAVQPHTSKALVATFCGVWPLPTMPIMEALPGTLTGKCLPELLGEQGYESMFFQSATAAFEKRVPLVKQLGFKGFLGLESMETDDFLVANYFGYEDEIMLPDSREWLIEQEKPFMTTYLTVGPHHDYQLLTRYPYQEFVQDEEFNRYLNNLMHTDHFVRKLIDQYKELGLYESTIFMIFADHGEGFGEHGRYQHDSVIYQEGLHVPMLIHDPQKKQQARRVTRRVTQLDLLPTAADLLGFEVIGADLPGMSVFDAPPQRQIFFECWYTLHCIGTIDGNLKYIHHYNAQPDEVFDLVKDPEETQNIIEDYSDQQKIWREQLLDWRARIFDTYGY